MAAANVRKFVIFCSFLALGTCVSILLMNLLLSRISKQALELIGSAVITITPNQKNKTLLLLYNEFFGNKEWMTVNEDCSAVSLPRTGAKPCLKDNFEITSDKSRFYESDFVMVHVSSNLPSLHHLKTVRRQKPYVQLWIFYTMESPRLSPDVKRFTDLFDLTFTYRVDSDFWATYGSYEEIPFVNLSQQDFSAGKSKLVAWVVSNCQPYLRKAVVHELQKHITIDVYGRCSGEFAKRRSCPGGTCRDIIRQYKFYLSFENALCEDYITEKYWRHLGEENVVPIVLGGANYTKLAIPGSYINVLDFKTVKDLADYLHYLDKNSTAYNQYFMWRQKYRELRMPHFCSFCEVLSSGLTPKGFSSLTNFWETQGKCGEKDLLVVNMWTHLSEFPAYFAVLMTSILIILVTVGLLAYLKLFYRAPFTTMK